MRTDLLSLALILAVVALLTAYGMVQVGEYGPVMIETTER